MAKKQHSETASFKVDGETFAQYQTMIFEDEIKQRIEDWLRRRYWWVVIVIGLTGVIGVGTAVYVAADQLVGKKLDELEHAKSEAILKMELKLTELRIMDETIERHFRRIEEQQDRLRRTMDDIRVAQGEIQDRLFFARGRLDPIVQFERHSAVRSEELYKLVREIAGLSENRAVDTKLQQNIASYSKKIEDASTLYEASIESLNQKSSFTVLLGVEVDDTEKLSKSIEVLAVSLINKGFFVALEMYGEVDLSGDAKKLLGNGRVVMDYPENSINTVVTSVLETINLSLSMPPAGVAKFSRQSGPLSDWRGPEKVIRVVLPIQRSEES